MLMSHTCDDFTCLPSDRLIVNGFFAGCLFLISTLTMTKIGVAAFSGIASSVAIVSAFKYCGIRLQNTSLAAAAIDDTRLGGCLCIILFDVTTVSSLSLDTSSVINSWVGFRDLSETKLLHLCAIIFSAPHRQSCV
jgi:hypothetical protein